MQLEKGKLRIDLQDLTGFEGRCDAIYFTTDANQKPPEKPDAAMRAWRKKLLGLPHGPPDAGEFDLVVVGGGTAGSCSAAAGAQKGLKVALIQDRPVLGGNSSPEVRVPIEGIKGTGPDRKDAKVHELTQKNLVLMKAGLKDQPGLNVFMWTHAFAVEKDGPRIKAVLAQHCLTGQEVRFRAPLFVDCTGDGTLGFLAGADYRFGREAKEETGEPRALPTADGAHMGMTLYRWGAIERTEPSAFPDCPWAIRITDENYEAAVVVQPPKSRAVAAEVLGCRGGDWTWESGFFDQVPDNDELVRDRLFRAIYGLWDYQKNRAANKAKWANWKLSEVPYVGGKRESRRLLGDVILAALPARTDYPDGIVSLGWGIDLHYPTEAQRKFFPGEEFRSWFWQPPGGAKGGQVGLVPFRSLYSRNVPNLMMAGRCMSATHVAMGATRVMGTGAKCGTVTGLAAALCKKHNCTPRELYEKHLAEFMGLVADPGIN